MAEPRERKGEVLFEYVKNAALKKGFPSMNAFTLKCGIALSPIYRMREIGSCTPRMLEDFAKHLSGCFVKAEFLEIKARNDAEIVKAQKEAEAKFAKEWETMSPEERAKYAKADDFIKGRTLQKSTAKTNKPSKNTNKSVNKADDRYNKWNIDVDSEIKKHWDDLKYRAVINQIKQCLDEIIQGKDIAYNAEIINYGSRWLQEYEKERKVTVDEG